MDRRLPIVVAQVPARDPAVATRQLRAEVRGLMADFPRTKMIVYPEFHPCAVAGTPDERRTAYERIAEPLDGPRARELAELARAENVWLLPGTVIERGPRGELFNTLTAFSPAGELVAAYRKIFPWRPFEPFTSGTEFVTFDIPDIGTVGLGICYDIWFPEVGRHLAYNGADLAIYPAQTSTSDREQELVLARATSIQNQMYTVSVNAAAPSGTGRSIIVDPEGLVRSQAPSESPTFLTDVLDFGAVARVRDHGTCGLNRMWSQVRGDDAEIPLPLYDGSITAARWGAGKEGENRD
ncbi:carbon-nitrogen hydrolase family protein [Mycolicibacterium sp.]|uniref:carbon-nitrogen hydrolase family protein n=1 Tax=Mycolicibacterium sp. TaxID=2320850 RepID=UPI00355FBD2A